MKDWLSHWYNKYAVMALTAALCIGGYEAINWNCLSASDWGTWVGAVGTVATLAMTIWLATDASRAKREEQQNLALVVTAGLMVRLRNIARGLATASAALEAPLDQPDDPRITFAKSFQRIDGGDLWTEEQLVPLVYLPNHIAARLAWIGINVQAIKTRFRRLSEEDEQPTWDVMALLSTAILSDLNSTLAEISRVMSECTEFLLEHGFEYALPTDARRPQSGTR